MSMASRTCLEQCAFGSLLFGLLHSPRSAGLATASSLLSPDPLSIS